MKELKVILIDKDTIQLEEDGKKGDIINLKSIANIDREAIDEAIKTGKDLEYNKNLERVKKELEELFKKEKASSLNEQKLEYEIKIKDLEQKLANLENNKEETINNLNEGFKLKMENSILQAVKEKDSKISELESKISKFEAEAKLASNELENKLNNDNSLKIEAIKKEYEEKLVEKNQELEVVKTELGVLKETKARLNNKEVGEDLEKFCDDAMANLMQLGFDNCEWKKDTDNIKGDDDKATKADFTFKVYLNESHTGEELTSVCIEAKNEQIDSKHRLKNSNHYEKLDKDRSKKKCQYALLVSNLEQDNENILPIYKVNGYKDMYVVRPVYLTTFITMITSLTMKFKDVIVADKNKELDLIAKQEFLSEFEKVKNTYLDKPLELLGKELDNIRKANSNIQEAALKINQAIDNIINKYVSEINSKIDKFTSNMTKSYKKLD